VLKLCDFVSAKNHFFFLILSITEIIIQERAYISTTDKMKNNDDGPVTPIKTRGYNRKLKTRRKHKGFDEGVPILSRIRVV
jgi:hypothetical protein